MAGALLFRREVLGPSAIDQIDDGLVHHQRCGISLFPGCIDTDSSPVDGPRSDEDLFTEQHVARGVKASKDPPLNIFSVLQFNVRTHRDDEPYTQPYLDEVFKNRPAFPPYDN